MLIHARARGSGGMLPEEKNDKMVRSGALYAIINQKINNYKDIKSTTTKIIRYIFQI